MSPPKIARSAEEQRVACQLGAGRYLPGTFDKRFTRSMCEVATTRAAEGITDKQRATLWQIAWKYRRQLTDSLQALIPTQYRKK